MRLIHLESSSFGRYSGFDGFYTDTAITIYKSMVASRWRLTRNRYGRALYDRLAARGIRASLLIEYRRAAAAVALEPPDGVRIEERRPETLDDQFRNATALPATDVVLVARSAGERVGSTLLTFDRSLDVPELGSEYEPAGVYIWKVYVAEAARGQGIGSALVRAAVRATAEREIEEVVALVARDNLPSKKAFAGAGFGPVVEHQFVTALGQEFRRTVPQ